MSSPPSPARVIDNRGWGVAIAGRRVPPQANKAGVHPSMQHSCPMYKMSCLVLLRDWPSGVMGSAGGPMGAIQELLCGIQSWQVAKSLGGPLCSWESLSRKATVMSGDFGSVFGIALLVLAGALFWLGVVAERQQRGGHGLLSETPAVPGVPARAAAVMIAAVAIFFMFLPH